MLIQSLESQAKTWKPDFHPMATTWLNQGRWDVGQDGDAKPQAEDRRSKFLALPPDLQRLYAANFTDILTQDEALALGVRKSA